MGSTKWKKLLLSVCFASCLFILSGCSFSDLMSKSAGVNKDPDYQTWERLSENGKLNSDGKYTADAVHVTFSRNSFLEIHYFSDPDMTDEFSGTDCYLLPGDILYYTVNTAPSSDGIYFFERLDVVEYDASNHRGNTVSWHEPGTSALQIPYDYKGTEISIEPAGHFGSRQLYLRASDSEGQSISNGKWYIDSEAASSETVSVNPLDSYCIEYLYDPSQYYLVSANPAPWKSDEGIVVFNISHAKTGSETYDLTFDKYITANISVKSGEIISVFDENGTVSSSKTDERNWIVYRVRDGSKMTVRVTSDNQNNISISCPLPWKQKGGPKSTSVNGQTQYDYEIEFGDLNRFVFIPSEYTFAHGTIEFSCNGTPITERITLESGSEIKYSASSIEDGFWLPDNGGTILVSGSGTAAAIREISFFPYKTVSVLLPQPTSGGKIIYSTAAGVLEGTSVDLLCGTRIYADFNAEKGWESKLADRFVYTVSTDINQSVNFQSISADGTSISSIQDIFIENEGHKPALTVSIHKNVGPCKTSITASGYSLSNQSVSDGNSIFDAFKTIVSDEKIGTDKGLTFIFSNIDLPDNNNALRITVTKETKSGQYKEIYYANRANTPVIVSFDRDKDYTSLRIQIEAVVVSAFQPIPIPDTDVSVQFVDTTPDIPNESEEISAGTLISGERQIQVTITPHAGFFMDGENTKDDVYQRKMSYDAYQKLSPEEILKQRKIICTVDLVTDDEYGTVEYYVDGQLLSGKTSIREGKEIVVKYTLTDDSYEIVAERYTLTQAIGIVDQSVSRKIEIRVPVTPGINNTSLQRKDIITVQRKVSE